MAKSPPGFEELVRRVGPLPVTGLASAETPPENTGTKSFSVSRAQAREVTQFDAESGRADGVSLVAVARERLAGMETDLRRMVSEYDGHPTRPQELLGALVIAEEEGVRASSCAEIRHELATRVRKLRAA
jgi:hypothetical protein